MEKNRLKSNPVPRLTGDAEFPRLRNFMVSRILFLILCCLCAFSWSNSARGQTVQRVPESLREAERLEAQAVGNAGSLFEQAQSLEASGQMQSAFNTYRQIVRSFPLAPEAPRAQMRAAEILEGSDPNKAFDMYQILITKYPDSPDFERAVAAQIGIANQYLQGKRVNFLGFPLLNSAERTQKMFANIVSNAPFSKYAPIAQFNLGLAFERQGKVQDAINAYQTVLDRYPNSDACDDALYQMGYIYMRVGFVGGSQDLSALVLAKNTFEDFLLQYPNSEKVAQAQENLQKINDRESNDILRIAQFYDRYRDYKSAVIYYNDVIRRQPQSPDAELAKSRIEVLRGDLGDDALRPGPERAETGEKAALRRRLQQQVETSALSDYSGPPKRDIVPDELPVVSRPRLRSNVRDVQPLPAVEPSLPSE